LSGIGKFIGVGVGPGPEDLMTLRALKALQSADVIFEAVGKNSAFSVSGRIVETIEGIYAEHAKLVFSMSLDPETRRKAVEENAEQVARELRAGRVCAFATIGDPMTYSTYSYLLAELRSMMPDLQVETVPGVTSYQAAAAAAGTPLVENDEILSVVPAFSGGNLPRELFDSSDTLVFLKTYRTRKEILDKLGDNWKEFDALYAARLGLDGETLSSDTAEMADLPEEYLSLLIAKKRKTESRK